MTEYIERESAKRAIDYAVELSNSEYDAVCNALDGLPAADVVMARHGRWGAGKINRDTGEYSEQCLCCGEWSKEYDGKYCSNCGAIMDGGMNNA